MCLNDVVPILSFCHYCESISFTFTGKLKLMLDLCFQKTLSVDGAEVGSSCQRFDSPTESLVFTWRFSDPLLMRVQNATDCPWKESLSKSIFIIDEAADIPIKKLLDNCDEPFDLCVACSCSQFVSVTHKGILVSIVTT